MVTTVSVGEACASFFWVRTLLQVAEDEKGSSTFTARRLRTDFYVDHFLSDVGTR